MVKKHILLVLILGLQASGSLACLNTYQFKIFPVGVSGEQVVTVDVQIRRTSTEEGKSLVNLRIDNPDAKKKMWVLYAFVSAYDKEQNLISTTPLDTSLSIGEGYRDTLREMYAKGVSKIHSNYPNTNLFKPEHLSFCGFHQICDHVKIDTANTRNQLLYKGTAYNVDILRDTSFYGFKKVRHPEAINALHVSSLRIYKTDQMELIVTHLATGHEITMGMISSGSKKATDSKRDKQMPAKNYQPDVGFNNLKESIYKEPVLHHGYGIDVFVVR